MKKVTSVILCILMFAAAVTLNVFAAEDVEPVLVSTNTAYTDLDADWYREAAEKYGYPEIFGEDGLFMPGQTITRMEFVRLLHRALGININYFAATDIAEYFTDLKNDDVGAGELYDLVTAGIVKDGGEFLPGEPLTREVMIGWTIAGLNYVTGGEYPIPLIMPAPFNDDAEIAEEYKGDVINSVILGLVKGRGDNMLFPKAGATRAEAVAVVGRLVDLVDGLNEAKTKGVKVSADAAVSDGALKMTLTLENNTEKAVSIEHTSGQKYDFIIRDAGGETLYAWSADKSFIQSLTATELEPSARIEFSETVDAETYAAIKDKIASIKAYIVGASEDFEIDTDGYMAELNESR